MPRIFLLRHGSSHSNENGSSADSWEIALTSTGEVQAREAAHHWSKLIGFGEFRLVSSPMRRARQTAEHVRALHPQVVLEVVHEFREFEPYDFSQLPAMTPAQRKPLMSDYWASCDPDRFGDGPRAESFSCFKHRVEVALAGLQSSDLETLVVCHGGVIKMADLLLDPRLRHLDAATQMRAWMARPTIQNCGLWHSAGQVDA